MFKVKRTVFVCSTDCYLYRVQRVVGN